MRMPVRRFAERLRAWLNLGSAWVTLHLNRIILVSMAGTGTVISIDLLVTYAAIAPEAGPLLLLAAVLFACLRRTKPRRLAASLRGHLLAGYSLLAAHTARFLWLAAIGGAAAIGLDLAAAFFATGPAVFPLLVLAGVGIGIVRRIRPRLAG